MDKVVSFHALDPSRWASACVFFCKPNIQSGLNAYQIQQLLYPAVSSEQSSVLDKAVYYSQFLNANLEFSGLTGGKAIRWESSMVPQRTRNQSWHLKSLGVFSSMFSNWTYLLVIYWMFAWWVIFWPEADNSNNHDCDNEDQAGSNGSYDERKLLLPWLWRISFKGQGEEMVINQSVWNIAVYPYVMK